MEAADSENQLWSFQITPPADVMRKLAERASERENEASDNE